jgi:hypothetical protein
MSVAGSGAVIMTTTTRKKYEMLLSVKGFGTAHRELFPEASAGAKAFTSLDEVVVRIETLAEERAVLAAKGPKARMAARAALKTAMRDIAVTARGIELTPGGRNTLVMPRRASDIALLTSARSFVREAEAVKGQLVELGLAATCLSDLENAADVFEVTMEQRRAERRSVAASNAAMKVALADAARALAKLDIVVRNACRRDPAMLAAWTRDRKIVDGRSPAPATDNLNRSSEPGVALDA